METLWSRTLSCGTLSVIPTGADNLFDELFEVAERRNPKRAFLFVSKVLGRHIPVAPAKMRQVYRQLAQCLPALDHGPVLFIGMAETAVGLGAGVFDEARHQAQQPVYLTSTRHPQTAELLCEFKENHSHATDHLIYLPENAELRQRVLNARTLVLIDDEATTGNTFINLLQALRQEGGLNQIERVITVTLTDWSGDALTERSPLPVYAVSLAQGSWQWLADPAAPLPEMPATSLHTTSDVPLIGKQSWGRLGMQAPAADLGCHIQPQPGEKILVLGSSEFVWEPFLLAERLAAKGAEVKYSSTTRSPIAPGFAIESIIAFNDNYGLGIANFVYNVAHQRFDRILLCIETPASSVDPQLLTALQQVAAHVEVICYD